MDSTCLNCGTDIPDNFCSNCGQKKYKRIDRKYIWDEVQYTTIHMNKGFLYSIKNTLKNPGKTARIFVDGNRVNHYKPIALAFLLSGISAFVAFKFIGLNELLNAYQDERVRNMDVNKSINSFNQSYNAFIVLLLIPFFALLTRLSFKSWGHNYYEHVVMNAYIISYYTILNLIIAYPLMYIFKDSPSVIITISTLSMLSFLIILPYFFKEFYAEHPFKKVLLKFLIFLGLTVLSGIIMMILFIIGLMIYASIHPEALKQFVPKKP